MHKNKAYTFITGASSGMGEATALLLAGSRNLVLHGRDKERLAATAEACREQGADVLLFPYDLEDAEHVGGAFGDFLKANPAPIEAFAHFAGMTEILPISKTKYSVGLKVMNVNYFSAIELISCLLKKKHNGANLKNIILVSTIIVNGGKKYQPHYCASKGAINALGMALATELAPQVRVNIIAPGSFKTRITQTIFASMYEDAPWTPPTLLPPSKVDEIAKVARFLLSDDAAYITGQIINVDGGEHMPRF